MPSTRPGARGTRPDDTVRRGALTPGRTRRTPAVAVSTALVAALLAAVALTIGRGGPLPVRPAAAEPAPGRLAYSAGYENRSLMLLRGPDAMAPLLGAGEAADDCQPAVHGDTVVWVSDRNGGGEDLMVRSAGRPASVLLDLPGWRIKHPAISPDGAWVAFTAWHDASEWDWCRQDPSVENYPAAGADPDATPAVWMMRLDGTERQRVVAGGGWPSWSPDGREIAFERNRRIHRVTVPTLGPVTESEVDTGPGEARSPAWEPVGGPGHGRIAYVTLVDQVQALAVVPTSGADRRAEVLARGSGESAAEDVAWSPDGTALAFLSGLVLRVDSATGCPTCTGTRLTTDPDQRLESVAWYSPPGGPSTVLLTRLNIDYSHLESARPADPLDRHDLLPQDQSGSFSDDTPAWSPDGQRVAFVRTTYHSDAPSTSRVLVGDPNDLGRAEQLTGTGIEDRLDQLRPAWSPDGSRLVLAQAEPESGTTFGASRITVADVSGGVRNVPTYDVPTPDDGCTRADTDPTWSADGTRIAFSRGVSCPVPVVGLAPGLAAAVRHVWSVRAADGADPRDLTAAQCGADCPVADQRPAYAPVGDRLALRRTLLTVEPDPSPSPGSPSPAQPRIAAAAPTAPGLRADGPYGVLLTMGGGGQGCRIVVPWTGACPSVRPRGGPPSTGSPFRDPGSPAWSPDARQLAFDTEVQAGDGNSTAIGVADADTGAGRVLPAKVGTSQSAATWQPTADLDVALTADRAQPVQGETTVLTLTVTNLGPAVSSLTGTHVVLPAGLEAVGAARPSQGGCTAGALDCDLGRLAAGAAATVQVTARANGLGPQQATGRADSRLPDPRADNNQAQAAVTVAAAKLPDPAVTAQATPATVRVGEPAAVAFTVRNQGAATAYGVGLAVTVPPGLHVVSTTPACDPAACSIGTLTAGAQTTVTLVVTADTPLTATLTGRVGSERGDADPANDQATATLTVLGRDAPLRADPAVSVIVDPASAYVGGTVTARYTVRNLGPAPATGVTLTTAGPPGATTLSAPPDCTAAGCPIPVLAPGAATTVTVLLRPGAPFAGTVTGTLTTTGDDAQTANDTATAPLTVLQPAVRLDPVLGPPGIVTLAHGSSFPPGTALRLRWSTGVTAAAAPVTVAADGTFTAPVLALVQDTLGPRELIVTPAADPPAFGEVRTGFRVVPGVLQPAPYQRRR
ncbi:hypothetical protein [Kitasatospora paracochleata]|uniref:Repeat protein (TIGR01451 family) n=1 Tax=Kitasatospora paracochleata TaxID=58354 RepID=A0ABT1IVH5_9ACTN|nr:hypothetical protein [Kitasatospora paracochleata]MCP2309140.1 putative repeat protein (TIGR01451 family) [Kitasatospora paracochleata]